VYVRYTHTHTHIGRYEFKFIIDGEWRTDNAWPVVIDSRGILNNVLVVSMMMYDMYVCMHTHGLFGGVADEGFLGRFLYIYIYCVCVYIYIYIYIHIHVYGGLSLSACLSLTVSLCLSVSLSLCLSLSLSVSLGLFRSLCLSLSLGPRVCFLFARHPKYCPRGEHDDVRYVYLYVCMYAYTHIRTLCIFVCMYVCIYTHTHWPVCIDSRGILNNVLVACDDIHSGVCVCVCVCACVRACVRACTCNA
jgi:hypothetical protein